MAKYFDYDLVKSEDIMDFFASVERKAYGFFRVVLTPEKMVYFDKYNNKFPLSMAIIVYMDAKGTMRQVLFNKQNLNYSFQAAGKQDDCLVFSLNTETLIEKELLSGGAERFLAVLKTETSVVFIGYDGSYEMLCTTFCKGYGDQPSVADLLQIALRLPRRG